MDLSYSLFGEIAEIVRNEVRFLRHYWGEVLDNQDELNRGRILVAIPKLSWDTRGQAPWCEPRDKHSLSVPSIGEYVEVYFMEGDPNYPVYMGIAQELKDQTPEAYAGDPRKHILYQDKDTEDNIVYNSADGILTIFEGGEHYVKGDELKTQLQKNVDALTQLQSDFTTWTPVPNDGGLALKTLLGTGFLTNQITSLTNILSEVIKAL